MPVPALAMEPPIKTLSFEERIHRHARELGVQRCKQSGSELDDVLQAESEIRTADE
jgi:hypothetical protein